MNTPLETYATNYSLILSNLLIHFLSKRSKLITTTMKGIEKAKTSVPYISHVQIYHTYEVCYRNLDTIIAYKTRPICENALQGRKAVPRSLPPNPRDRPRDPGSGKGAARGPPGPSGTGSRSDHAEGPRSLRARAFPLVRSQFSGQSSKSGCLLTWYFGRRAQLP